MTLAKIVKFYETGGPDVMRVEEADPGAPGEGEVLIKIDAIGLNRGEAAFRGGHYLVKPALPSKIGSEASARVTALGPGVTGFKPGEAVFTLPTFVQGQYGIYASEAVVPASCLRPMPQGLDPVQSAAIWVAFLTAWGGMVETGKLQKGQHVLIPAASSSVGLAAVQIAKDIGAIPIATTRRRTKAAAIAAAGAAHVVATEEDDIAAEIARITNDKGLPFIFDPVAGPFAEKLFDLLAEDGVLMLYGGIANQPATFPRQPAIRKNLTMRGYNFFPLLRDPARFKVAYDYIAARVLDGRFKMPIEKTFSLDQIAEGHRTLEANQHIGKLVVIV
ncbi:MAG: zinc-dependent alcohol dehydrogenase family protein [Hyphomonadaceae bacterium]